MVNLLGDLWRAGREPDWAVILAEPKAKLHLYGQREPRPPQDGSLHGARCGRGNALAKARELKANWPGNRSAAKKQGWIN